MKFIKKLIIILAGIFAILLISATIFNHFYPMRIYYWLNPPKCPTCQHLLSKGKSMSETDKDGDPITYDTARTPKINDVIAFQCFRPECQTNAEDRIVKRLLKIDDRGCYWVEGDNKERSFDSRAYGWLCPPDDIKISGVVIQ